MPYIKVDLNKINGYASALSQAKSRVQRIKSDFSSIGYNLDWDVKSSSNISRRISTINSELSAENSSLSKMTSFLNNARQKYTTIDSTNKQSSKKLSTGATVSSAKVSFDSPFGYFDAKDFLKDTIKTGGTIYGAYKAGFFTSGFNVKQVGDYVRVYGKNKTWLNLKDSTIEGIKGRRYKVGSELDVKFGVSARASNISLGTKFSRALNHNFKNFGKDTFGSAASIIGYLGVAWETIDNAVGNVKSGASVSKIAADATTDVAKGLGAMAAASAGAKLGAAIGTLIPVPVVGTLVGGVIGGAVAGFAYDYLIDGGLKIGGKSIAGWVSTGLEKAYTAVGDAVTSGAKAVANVAKTVTKTVTNAVSSAAKSVGNAVKSAAKGVKNFFGKLFG